MALIDPPAFLGLAGNEYPAARLRRAHQLLLAAREGVIRDLPAYPTPLAVTQTGTPSLSVQVAAGAAVINGDDSTRQGAYLVENDGPLTVGPVATPHATLPRIDRVVLRVYDQEGTGTGGGGAASDEPALEIITGTPASTPSPPAEPPTAVTLALVTVGASASSITNASIADARTVFRLAATPILTADLGAGAVTAAILADNAVLEAKIAGGAITRSKITPLSNAAISLAGAWSATGGGHHSPVAQRDVFGRVYLRGLVTAPDPVTSQIGTVPAGFRPWANETFSVGVRDAAGGIAGAVSVTVQSDGGLLCHTSYVGPGVQLSLSGITYHTDT